MLKPNFYNVMLPWHRMPFIKLVNWRFVIGMAATFPRLHYSNRKSVLCAPDSGIKYIHRWSTFVWHHPVTQPVDKIFSFNNLVWRVQAL